MENNSMAIVLVNYFNDEEVSGFIRSQLYKQSLSDFVICVVNNGSKGSALEDYCRGEDRVRYFNPGKNLGYIGGFLFAFENLRGARPGLVILSNTDISIEDHRFLEKVSAFTMDEQVAMLGPSVISSRTGHNQNPFYEERLSLGKLRLLKIIFSNYGAYLIYQLLGMLKGKIKGAKTAHSNFRTKKVYAIHGSFMVFGYGFLEKYMDELKDAPFLFGEEIQFAEVALRHGKQTLFVPELRIVHHEHATTRQFKSGKMLKHLKESIEFMINKRTSQKKEGPVA
jgi:GT2 family glycosyltransferase